MVSLLLHIRIGLTIKMSLTANTSPNSCLFDSGNYSWDIIYHTKFIADITISLYCFLTLSGPLIRTFPSKPNIQLKKTFPTAISSITRKF